MKPQYVERTHALPLAKTFQKVHVTPIAYGPLGHLSVRADGLIARHIEAETAR